MFKSLQRFLQCHLNGVKVVNTSSVFSTIDVKLNIPHRRGGQKMHVKVQMEVEECRNGWNPASFYRINVNTTLNNTSKKALSRYPSLRTFRAFEVEEQHTVGYRLDESDMHTLAEKMATRFVSHLERLMHNRERLPYKSEGGVVNALTAVGELPVPKRVDQQLSVQA